MHIKKFLIVMCALANISSFAQVKISGVQNTEILDIIKNQIILNKEKSSNEQTSIAHEFKIKNDIKTIKIILSSFGYFDAEVSANSTGGTTVFHVILNTRYKLNEIILKYVDFEHFRSGITIEQVFDLIDIKFDSYTTTKQIAGARTKIVSFLKKHGFALVEIDQPQIEINQNQKKIKAIYNIKLNKKIIIDKTIIKINSQKDPALLESFVSNRIAWQDGEVWDIAKIDATKEDLMNCGFFSEVLVNLSEPIADKAKQNIAHCDATIELSESLLRNIAIGAKYGTNEKVGTTIIWSHYNIDGKGAFLSTAFNASNLFDNQKRDFSAKVEYNMQDVFAPKQEMRNHIGYNKSQTLAYELSKFEAHCVLWKSCTKVCKIGFGLLVEQSKTTDLAASPHNISHFDALGIPLALDIDTTDSFFNPQKGLRFNSSVTYYITRNAALTKTTGKISAYIPIKKNHFKKLMVLAMYGSAGAIFCKTHIPRDKFFFAGGGNSVRGYGEQKLCKITEAQVPLGGKYTYEFGIEPRISITNNIELAVFLEAGNVFSDTKDFASLFVGYGIGVRYNTPLGPVRLDIGFPTTKRKPKQNKKTDASFNIYLSIGQAF